MDSNSINKEVARVRLIEQIKKQVEKMDWDNLSFEVANAIAAAFILAAMEEYCKSEVLEDEIEDGDRYDS